MTRGILRWESSLMAICNASVSPSNGTNTGAFILTQEYEQESTEQKQMQRYGPNLQRPSPQHSCPLVLREVGCCDAHFIGLPLALHSSGRCSWLTALAICWLLRVLRTVRGVAVCLLAFAVALRVRDLRREEVVVLVLGSALQVRQRTAEWTHGCTNKRLFIEPARVLRLSTGTRTRQA